MSTGCLRPTASTARGSHRTREEEARRAEKALADSLEKLLKIIAGWEEANWIEGFYREIEARASGLDVGTALALCNTLEKWLEASMR